MLVFWPVFAGKIPIQKANTVLMVMYLKYSSHFGIFLASLIDDRSSFFLLILTLCYLTSGLL